MDDRTESTFGSYVLYERIGAGGMAEAYVASRLGAPDYCVVKLVRDATSEVARQRMRREASAGIYLAHENLVRTLDAGTVSGTFFVAVELIIGVDLTRWLAERGPLPVPVVASVLAQALAGLEYAHGAEGPDGAPLNLVHRDLSPANLMVAEDGCVKIIDFGLVRADVGDARTRPGMVMGTLGYVSPEQAVSDPVDARSDLYSLSAVAYELLTGAPVARGQDANAILRSVLSEVPPPIRSVRAEVPAALAEAIERGLAKAPKDRHADARAYLDAIHSVERSDRAEIGRLLREDFPSLAERRAKWARSSEGPQEPTRTAPRPEAPGRRYGGWAIGIGLAVVVALGVVLLRAPDREIAPPRTAPTPAPRAIAPRVAPREVEAPSPEPPPPPRTEPPPRRRARPARRARPEPTVVAPPNPKAEPKRAPTAAELTARFERVVARAERLEASESVQRFRAELTFVRASGVLTEDVVARLQARLAQLERAAR